MHARLGRDVTLTLVTSLVLLRLDYCNSVLAGLPASILAPLQRILHAAARLVNGLCPHDHVSTTNCASWCTKWWSAMRHPTWLVCWLQSPMSDHDLLFELRPMAINVVPMTRLKFGERAFSVAAPEAWNRLPTELKLMLSTPAFKRCLKTFFFRTAYCNKL